MSQTDLARRMGRPAQVVNEIINGKKSLTLETALELERVLDTPAPVWVNLEGKYQLALARLLETEALEEQAPWLDRFPVRDMEQRGWIPAASRPAEKVRALLRFFGVASFSRWEEYQEALGFRITGGARIDVWALAAWVRKGELDGRNLATREYDESQFREALTSARNLTRKEPQAAWKELQELCASCGVAALVIKEFPKIGANGVARWLSPKKGLIQLNLRYSWADIFWFTFFHEAAHILTHESRQVFVDLDGNPRRDPRESEANRLAEELMIPTDAWETFVLHSDLDIRSVEEFANDLAIHPGIVVGRLQHLELAAWNSGLNSLRERLIWAN